MEAFIDAQQVTICAVDFGPDYFAYWIGELNREKRNADGSLVNTLSWSLEHPSEHAPPNAKNKMWREDALREIIAAEPLHERVNLYDTELQNPMGAHLGPGRRAPGNSVAYGMSRTFIMHVKDQNDHLPSGRRKREVLSSHGVQKFTTFGVHRPCVGTDGQKKYRRKRASVAFAKAYLREYPLEGRRWNRVLERHAKKQDDLADVLWAGLSRAVRIYRMWTKKGRKKKKTSPVKQ